MEIKCDYCEKPATTFDTQHLCSEHNARREMIRKRNQEILKLKQSYDQKIPNL